MRKGRAPAGQGADAVARLSVPPEIVAEASVWVARLHGPHRSAEMERECRAWQARSVRHRLAFERCTDTWQEVAGLSLATAYAGQGCEVQERRAGWWRPGARGAQPVLAFIAVLLCGLWMWPPWRLGDVYDTGVGEQRVVVLEDGTRLSLNTATKVRVSLGATRRTVAVDEGEAMFEVAKDAMRPFVVLAAGTEVVATGTAFSVRLGSAPSESGLTVTLLEGEVLVREQGEGAHARLPPAVLAPGQRLRVSRPGLVSSDPQKAHTVLDRPPLAHTLAWRRGEVALDDQPLQEAVAEMNRYLAVPIVLVGWKGADGPRVSGLFRIGDGLGFARAVADLHGLSLRECADRLELLPR